MGVAVPKAGARGMKGVYQHCEHNHLHRYLAEFDFRYNYRIVNGVNDARRADLCGADFQKAMEKLLKPKGKHGSN